MKDSPSAPQSPDPVATSQAQFKMNADLAKMMNQMGKVNTNTPWGNLNFTQGQTAEGTPSDTWTADISLSPQQQQMLNYQGLMGLGAGQAGSSLAQQMQQNFSKPFDPYQFKDFSQGPTTTTPQAMVKNLALDETPWQTGAASSLPIQGSFDTSKVSPMGNPYGYASDATNAIMSRTQPQLQWQKQALDTQLANQGIPMGSEAYNKAQQQFGWQANDAVQQAILGGYDLGNKQFQNTLAANQQGFGQAAQQAGFGNQAQAQDFGQSMQNAQLSNQVKESAFGQNLATAQFANQAQQQMFNQGATGFNQQLQAGQYSDVQRQQDIMNQLQLYQLPMNQLQQLQGMSQVTSPNFPQFGTPQGTPTNLMGAYQNQYQGQLNQYNADVGSANSMNSGLMSLGSSAILAFAM